MTFRVKDGISVNGTQFVDTSTNVRALSANITSSADASGVNTGALQVTGGASVGGSVFVAGVVTATSFVGAFAGTVSGTATSANNLTGGTAGQFPYQTAPGSTSFVSTGSMYVASAVTAEKWRTSRTITLGGDLTGSVSIDGSQDVTLNATVSGNTVALGTDTTGAYLATASAGTGISVAGSGDETANITITNLGVTSIAGTSPIAVTASTGSVTVSLTTASTYVDSSVKAEKWRTARTFTFGGDLAGSMVVDGSQDVTFTATITADATALGTDTTGVYLATATAGTGISVAGSGVETADITITNLGVTGLTAGGGVTVSSSTGSVTLGFTTSTLVTTASNLAGGSAGQFAYQTAAGQTAFVSTGSMYVYRATQADSAAGQAGSVANALTIGSGLSGGSFNGSSAVTITNLGVTGLTAGTGIATNGSTGSLTLTNVGVTGLTGGGGVTVSASTGSITLGFTTSTLVTTASNLAGGTAGQLAYQSAAGTTAFAGPGTAGQLLMSAGTSAPTYTNTASIYVDSAVKAETLRAGTAGAIVYQSAADTSAFLALSGTQKSLLTAGASAPVYVTQVQAQSGTGSATGATGQSLVVTSGGLGVTGDSYFANKLATGGTLAINDTSANTGTNTSNSLYTAGGAWVDKSLVVSGDSIFRGNVTFNGTSTFVYSTQTIYTDNILNLHIPPGGVDSQWTLDDGKDIGFRFHYYTASTDTNAALVLANDTKYLEWYSSGAEGTSTFAGSSYGTFKTGSIKLASGTGNAGNTSTGALTVLGGVGVSGGLYVGGTVTATSFVGAFAGTVSGTATSANNLTGGTAGQVPYQTGAGATSFYGPGTAGQILVSAGTSAPTYTNTASIYVGNTVNAEKWATARTVSFSGGDVTGSFNIDGSANVSNIALTIAADSVALGTDTTGNYVATATAGTGISVAGSGSETAAITITNLGVTSLAGTAPIAVSASTGSVTVSLTTASTYVANSVNAEKWKTPRTFTFGGDLSGSMVVDGSQDVTFTATISADSIALGTDTTGNYVAGISAGTAIAVAGSGAENATVTITNLGVGSLTGGGGVTVSASTGSVTLGFTTSTLVTTASNLAGGSAGQFAYQSAAGTTAFVSTGSMYVYRATQADSASGSAGSVANALTIGSGLSGGSFNGSAAVTITNLGVTSLAGTAPIAVSASTGSVTVSLTTASTYVANAVSAEKWLTPRTFTFGGDLSGSMVVDGSQNVTFTATIAADSVALGTDTTGNYVAGISAGTAIAVAGSGAENATVTITNLGVASLTAGGGVTVSASTGSVTLGFTTSTLVTTASNLAGGTAGQIHYQSGAGVTAFAGPGTAGQLLMSAGTSAPVYTSTSSIYVNRAVTADNLVGGSSISGNLTVTGNLTVQGTTVTVDSTVTNVADPIITIGGGANGAAPTADDGKDRGIAFQWHNGTAAKVGFFGFDDSTGYLAFVPDATITNEVVSGSFGDIQATNFRGTLVGSISNALTIGTGLGGTSYNGSSAVTITNTGVTSNVAGTGISVSGATGAVTITNTGVTSLTGGGGVTVSGGTGGVTLGFTTSTLVTTASNLAGGAAGLFAYQTAAGTTAFAATGTIYVNRAVTADNGGVTSIVAGTGVSISGGTGAVTVNIGQAVATSSNVQFNSLGVGTAGSATAGEIRATNEITAYYSDRRLKENVKVIDNAVTKVLSLNGITYTPNELAESFGYDRTVKLVGLFADEVEAVLPEATRPAPFDQDENGNSKSGENYKTIQYEKLVPLLIEAIKEQQQQIAQLYNVINNMANK